MAIAKDIIGNKFGPLSQITIIKRLPLEEGRKSKILRYSVSCSICKEDSELFGNGIFETDISNLKAGKLPCGCSLAPKWTEGQMKVRLKRKSLESNDVSFIDFAESFKGNTTKIILSCNQHGEWSTSNVANYLNRGKGCPSCRRQAFGAARKKSDEDMIESFFFGNTFHKDTKFTRTNKTSFWSVYCPVCDTTNDSFSGSLQVGCKPCRCSRQDQKYAYVNVIKDAEIVIAVKFGITGKSSKERSYEQNRKSVFDVSNLITWEFSSQQLARSAEKFCKDNLDTAILLKEEMPDGYTETTFPSNIDFIIRTFDHYGGVKINKNDGA